MVFCSILVALALSAFTTTQGTVVALSRQSSDAFRATLLAEQKLTEMEYKIRKEGFAAYGETEEGEFEEPFQDFSWKLSIKNSGIDLLLGANTENEKDQSVDPVKSIANQLLNQSIKLVECTVSFGPEKRRKSVTLQTYIAKLDIAVPGVPTQ